MSNEKHGQSSVCKMFGRISRVYDLLNHVLSLGIDRKWRAELATLAKPASDGPVLDLAAGTLDVAIALANYASNIYALDFCVPMLASGMKKLDEKKLSDHVFPCCGNALALPYHESFFESVTIAFGIRNIADRLSAFREMLRVLKPGGKACILEFGSGREKIWGGIYNFYLGRILPGIGSLVGNDKKAYEYLAITIKNFPDANFLEEEMRAAGFIHTGWRKLTSGIVCLHWGEKSA